MPRAQERLPLLAPGFLPRSLLAGSQPSRLEKTLLHVRAEQRLVASLLPGDESSILSNSDTFHGHGHALAAADAERREATACLGALHAVQQAHQHARA